MTQHVSDVSARLFVLDGIHAGASMPLTEAATSVGGQAKAAAFLTDDSVSDSNLEIRLPKAGKVELKLVSGVARAGLRGLRIDKARTSSLPVSLRIGDVNCAVASSLSEAHVIEDRTSQRGSLLRWGPLAAGVVMLAAFVNTSGGFATSQQNAVLVSAVHSERAMGREDAAGALQMRLREAGFRDLEQSVSTDGARIVVTGRIDAAKQDEWNGIVRWFDGRYGAAVALETSVGAQSGEVVLPIRCPLGRHEPASSDPAA